MTQIHRALLAIVALCITLLGLGLPLFDKLSQLQAPATDQIEFPPFTTPEYLIPEPAKFDRESPNTILPEFPQDRNWFIEGDPNVQVGLPEAGIECGPIVGGVPLPESKVGSCFDQVCFPKISSCEVRWKGESQGTRLSFPGMCPPEESSAQQELFDACERATRPFYERIGEVCTVGLCKHQLETLREEASEHYLACPSVPMRCAIGGRIFESCTENPNAVPSIDPAILELQQFNDSAVCEGFGATFYPDDTHIIFPTYLSCSQNQGRCDCVCNIPENTGQDSPRINFAVIHTFRAYGTPIFKSCARTLCD